MREIKRLIEALIVRIALVIFGAMPFAMASDIGGFLGRKIGKYIHATKTARKNIKMAMPELSDARVEEIITAMWDNLGRIITEFSQLNKLTPDKISKLVTIEGKENLRAAYEGRGCLLFTGHFGNWEIIPPVSYSLGFPLHIVYRKANNPYVDKIIYKTREKYQASSSAKGSVGARQIIKSLQNNGQVIMLVDQKQNDGIAVPFFGINAMTPPGIATLALKYDSPIYPFKILRTGGGKFKFTIYPEVEFAKSGDGQKDTLSLMTQINNILEGWIRENPEQWFWVHNRWPKR